MERIFEKFYNTLKSNNVNTAILENNLRTLKVEHREPTRDSIKNHGSGFFVPYENKIVIYDTNQEEVLNHELLHCSSSHIKEDNSGIIQIYSGLSYTTFGKSIGDGINEGETEELNDKYFGTNGYAYLDERLFAKLFKVLVPRMEEYYFTGDFNSFVNDLTKYDSYENILKLIKNIDFYSKHRNNPLLSRIAYSKCYLSYETIFTYLVIYKIRNNEDIEKYKEAIRSLKRHKNY